MLAVAQALYQHYNQHRQENNTGAYWSKSIHGIDGNAVAQHIGISQVAQQHCHWMHET